MTPKQTIESALERYVSRKERLRGDMQAAQVNDQYSDTYRQEVVQGIERQMRDAGEQAYKDIEAIVGRVRDASSAQQAGHAQGKGTEYQLQLSNTLEMLKLGASQMTAEAIQRALLPYSGDTLAMAAFRGVLSTSGLHGTEVERILNPLNQAQALAEKLDSFLKSVSVIRGENPVFGMELGLASILYLLSRWNDDMTGWIAP